MKTPAPKPGNSTSYADLNQYVSWFEIPAQNFQRAVNFYNHLYQMEMNCVEMNGYAMAFFPAVGGVSGAVIAGEGCYPSDRGPIIYLNAGDDLNLMLGRVESGGGRVLMQKTPINDESGCFALFLDSEGNKLALHSKF